MNYLDWKQQNYFKETWHQLSVENKIVARGHQETLNAWFNELGCKYKTIIGYNARPDYNKFQIYGNIRANTGEEISFSYGHAITLDGHSKPCILFRPKEIAYQIILPIEHLNSYKLFQFIPISIQLFIGKNPSW